MEISADPGDLHVPPDPVHPQPIAQGVSTTPFPLATTFHILPVTILSYFFKMSLRDFPGGSVVETLVCHCRGVRVGSPGWEVRSHMPKARKKEGRQREHGATHRAGVINLCLTCLKKKSLGLAVSFPSHLFPSLRLILLLCVGSASNHHQSSKYTPLMVPHPGLKKCQPPAVGGREGGTGMCFLPTLHTGFLLP